MREREREERERVARDSFSLEEEREERDWREMVKVRYPQPCGWWCGVVSAAILQSAVSLQPQQPSDSLSPGQLMFLSDCSAPGMLPASSVQASPAATEIVFSFHSQIWLRDLYLSSPLTWSPTEDQNKANDFSSISEEL